MSIYLIFFFLIFFSLSSVYCALEGPRATSENGILVGVYENSQSGFRYKAFKGIPYAEPPVGKQRFKEPQRLQSQWIGEWNAQNFGSNCLQLNQFARTRLANGSLIFMVDGDEDCLFLNVFTRDGGPPRKDVIFALHGGGFMWGSGDSFSPTVIMDRDDVILVSVNYRLGPLGFLTTGDNIVPGNNGIKDQVIALEWVKRNIASFGGDPKKVTLLGFSAGGVSVDYMYLTPRTEGLFHRGYSYSGTSLVPWGLITDGVEKTKKIAENIGCPTNNNAIMVKCLRDRPAKRIVDQVRSFMVFFYNPFTVFGPVVEINSPTAIIHQHPRDTIRKKQYQKLPWIAGVTTEDGLYPSADFIAEESLLNVVDTQWEKIGPSLLFLNPKLSTREMREIANNARREYLGDKRITIQTRNDLVRLLSDRLFQAGILESVIQRDNTYLYLYGYQAQRSFAQELSGKVEDFGASHGDDLFLIFRYDSRNNTSDQKMTQILLNILITFVKEGKTPQDLNWKPISQSKRYLYIQSPDDISTCDQLFVDLNNQKQLYKE